MKVSEMEKYIQLKIQISKTNSDNRDSILWISGQPGIGKTHTLEAICKKNGWGLSAKYMGTMPLEMITGLPLIFNDDSDKEKSVQWTQPELVNMSFDVKPKDDKSPIILFLDDAHLCDKGIQKYMFQLLTYKSIHGHHLPDNVIIVMAGNRASDHAMYNQIAAPIANRIFFIDVQANSEDWINNFAIDYGIDDSIIAFIKRSPENLVKTPLESQAWTSPRSWTYLSNSLIQKTDWTIDELIIVANGHLGKETAGKFIEFRELLAKWNGRKILNGTDKVKWKSISKLEGYAILISCIQAFKHDDTLSKGLAKIMKEMDKNKMREIISLGLSILIKSNNSGDDLLPGSKKYSKTSQQHVIALLKVLGSDFQNMLCAAIDAKG